MCIFKKKCHIKLCRNHSPLFVPRSRHTDRQTEQIRREHKQKARANRRGRAQQTPRPLPRLPPAPAAAAPRAHGPGPHPTLPQAHARAPLRPRPTHQLASQRRQLTNGSLRHLAPPRPFRRL